MFLMENLNQRIEHILREKGIPLKKAATILGTRENILKRYMRDTVPTIEFLFALVEYFHVRPDYLITAREPVFMNKSDVNELNIEHSYF